MWKTEIKEKGQVGHERRKSLKIASVTSCIIVTASGLFVLFLFVCFFNTTYACFGQIRCAVKGGCY